MKKLDLMELQILKAENKMLKMENKVLKVIVAKLYGDGDGINQREMEYIQENIAGL